MEYTGNVARPKHSYVLSNGLLLLTLVMWCISVLFLVAFVTFLIQEMIGREYAEALVTALSCAAVAMGHMAIPKDQKNVIKYIVIVVCIVLAMLCSQWTKHPSVSVETPQAATAYIVMWWVICFLYRISHRLQNRDYWISRHLKSDLCPGCLYDIRGLPQPRCPECGAVWGREATGR